MISKKLLVCLTIIIGMGASLSFADTNFYWPYDNDPPGSPPNYNLVDSTYFQGIPDLPDPLTNNVGGYYIWNDTIGGTWHIANFNFTRGDSRSQFHGSILAIMDQDPQPNVNFWAQGFELTTDLYQNDRWGWVKWPDSIAENLYEIWWDFTLDYSKPNNLGDYRDTMGVIVAGCAVDFNIWSSGVAGGTQFSGENIYLGDDKIMLEDVPGFVDTYAGVTDQYQVGSAVNDPNTTRFTAKSLPGASYNVNGLITTGTTYGDRYAGSWAYEGNGIQFSTLFCPPNNPPNIVTPLDHDTLTLIICDGETVYDTVTATDPNPSDILTLTKVSGPGTFTSTPSVSPVTGYYELAPLATGLYTVVFAVDDGAGGVDTITVVYDITISTAPSVVLPNDTSLFICSPEQLCVPLEILDNDCDVTSVVTNLDQYSGTVSNFDQVGRINELGGTVTQIGGGDPGKVLNEASDFVPPVNSLSGVGVTLPNFIFADHYIDNGSFLTGEGPDNSVFYMLGAPTDLTFTTAGPGGPDGGDGDGSVAFAAGNYCILGFVQEVTTCNGANVDFALFSNTGGGGTVEVQFMDDGSTVYTTSHTVPGGTAGTGTGGVTFDLPDGVQFDAVRLYCVSGTFEIDAVAARTAPSPSSTDICVTLDTTGVYEITATATDACGNVGSDVMYVTVTRNSPPVANAGADLQIFVCDYSQICIPVSFSDPDNNLTVAELVSGPGTLSGTEVCFTPASEGTYTFIIRAVDECGLEDRDTVLVTVDKNSPPVASSPSTVNQFLCDQQQLCHTFTATDPDGGTLTWSLISGPGSITTGGQYCFTPTASGSYTAEVQVTDSCGAYATTSITYNVTLNSNPVAVDPTSPVDVTQCDPEEICYQFSATDVNGGSLTWSLLSGPGTITPTGLWCFTPTGSGAYTAVAVVSDACGDKDTTTLSYNVTINSPPTIAFGNDSSLALCDPQEICLDYTVSDPDGPSGLIEAMVSGFGTIDTAQNTVCFTPTTAGTYEFIVSVTDDCGEVDEDTVVVSVTFGTYAAIDCPTGPISVALCSPDQVCQTLGITPSTATVTTSFGTWSAGELCFVADTTGTYEITVIAESDCGSDTCDLVFDVTIGEAPQITCPDPQTKEICEPGTVCIPVGIMGAGAVVTVSPIGSYSGGNLCFPADTSGHYEIQIQATTDCGTANCTVVVDVTIDGPPVANDPVTPVDTFLCAADQICYQFTATDPDGDPLTWTRLSGNGTVTSDGLWCCNPTVTSVKTVTVEVTDACGKADTTSLTYNVTINSPPVLAFLRSVAVLFLCDEEQVCINYTATDPDDNIVSEVLTSGYGTIDTAANTVCFTPDTAGTYSFTVTVTDSCGAFSTKTYQIPVEFNSPPVVDAGADQTIFQCSFQQICWATGASDPDDNLVSVEMITGPGTFDGTNICFTPDKTWNYEFVLKATDECGAVSYDTVVVYYTVNSPPVANAGADQTITQCTPTQICWPASCTDVDGNLSSGTLISGPGVYDGSSICFTPAASGTYEFVLQATDACGATDPDTAVINVTINTDPVCVVPNDTTIFQCTATQVCLPAYATDIDDNLAGCHIVSGPGSLVGGNWCYTPTSSQAVSVTVRCEDDCGAYCESTFNVQFEINQAPTIAFGADQTADLCTPEQICLPFTYSDPNDPRPTTVSLIAGPGTLDLGNSRVCFTPSTGGTYQFIVGIEDECGRTDEDTINVTVTLNNEPVANAGADQTLFLCSSTQICWPASCSDPDGNLTDCIFNGPGSYDGSQICFTPTTSGTYTFTLRAEDDCGLFDVDEAVITVVLNEKPTVTFGNDTSLALCAQQQICLDYTVNDPDGHGKVLETMVAGYGALDTAANNICFTPTASGNYEFIVRATDSCGAFDEDTILVSVTYGTAANIDCPAGAIDVFLCDPDQVCRTIDITPSTAVITTSFGTYSGGDLCFQADTSGTYVIQLTAETDCGTDQCQLVFNVDIGTAPQITCPAPQSKFICQAGSVCIPVGVMGAGATVSVSPIGTYGSGNICFPADTSGHYELEVIATTACGADTCLVVADITINSRPVAVDPASPVDTFLCDPAEICYQFEASDADGQQLTWSKLNGNGSVTADGLWCFTPTGAFPYSVTVAVTDECGKSDTTNLTYNVVINSGPTVSFESQKSTPPLPPVEDVYLCGPEDICRTYITSDANDNIVLEEVETPGATIDTVANEICIYADTAGYYELIVTVTDDCGAYATSLIGLNVHFNTPPVANAGSDQTVEQCTPASICWPAGCTDDFGLDSCYLVTPVGSYDGSQICFTPDTAGTYTFILRAVDKCGEVDMDTALVTVDLNSSPVCQVPNDTSIFQCAAAEVSLPVSGTDPDGNFDHCELLRGPGSISGGQWTYTPTADQTVKVVVMCLDACGASCTDSFTVTFRINAPPVVDLGADTTIFLCQADSLCIDVDVSDEDNNLMLVEKLSVGGNYNPSTGELCFPTTYGVDKMYTLIMRATDSCGAVDVDTAKIYVDFNSPPVVEGPPDFTAFVEQPGELCFDVSISDQDENLTGVTVSPIGTYSSQTGQICFNADTTGTYCFTVTATDACGLQTVEVICVDVEIDECVHVQIEKVHNTLQGHIESVDINLNGSGKPLGGFEFLISYDASVLTALTASPGQLFESCGWEYFTYRYGVDGNCTGACPSGLIKIVGLAETNNGAYHPGCFFDGMVGTLASMEFLVSNNRNYECQFVPIEFFWDDCADNTFSSMAGDTMWISREVYGFELNNITDNSYGFPGKYGAPDLCLEGGGPGKPTPFRCVDFTNGGIDIICADSIDDRGDINLNGLAYEVADAVMFSNYFIYGLDAFGTGPQVEAAIAASDVNGDGIALSVADLVYLIRVVVGDAAAMPKPNPGAAYEAEFSVVNNVLTVSKASTEIGAIHLLIAGDARPSLDEHVTDMELQYRFDGADTRVLIYNRNASAYLEEGPILNLGTSGRIKSIEVGSFDGYVMAARLSSLPETYSLSQNYPNPFNPVTTIDFALPEAGEWELVIYNILGQVVEQWKEEGQAGYYKVEWDAGRYASGVYFYRLRAGEYSATRKMVLLK